MIPSYKQPHSIVQEWGPSSGTYNLYPHDSYVGGTGHMNGTRYRSLYEYRMSPFEAREMIPSYKRPHSMVQEWGPSSGTYNPYPSQSYKGGTGPINDTRYPPLYDYRTPSLYSTANRSFYPVVPHNVEPKYAPIARFDIPRLGQRRVQEIPHQTHSNDYGVVSLAHTVASVAETVGAIKAQKRNGHWKTLGTCTLISQNLAITARHVIEGRQIETLEVSVRLPTLNYPILFRIAGSVEDCPKCDYSIIKLESTQVLKKARLNIGDQFPGETALLHYPIGQGLRVSVHTLDEQSQQSHFVRCFHDSDYSSSGGAHFNPLGFFTAMHIGVETIGDGYNLHRCAITLQQIVREHPNSLLHHLVMNTTPKTTENGYIQSCLTPYQRSFLIEREGRKSQQIFTGLLKDRVGETALKKDKLLTQSGLVSFSEQRLQVLSQKYKTIFNSVLNTCLYRAGYHGDTKQYSMKGHIESDHLIPYDVWKKTTFAKMQSLIKGGGDRPGENEMPAITIPYGKHRDLMTTGSGKDRVEFRNQLTKDCDNKNAHLAFIKCFNEYKRNGIFSNKKTKKAVELNERVKTAVEKCLTMHIDLRVIKADKKQYVLEKCFY